MIRDVLAEGLKQGLIEHIVHLVGIYMTATDKDQQALDRFRNGARVAIRRYRTLLELLEQTEE
jgi:hypothetical protein